MLFKEYKKEQFYKNIFRQAFCSNEKLVRDVVYNKLDDVKNKKEVLEKALEFGKEIVKE